MDSAGGRLMLAGFVLLAIFAFSSFYVEMQAASWERIEPTRKLEYVNQTMERELGRPVTPDAGLLQSATEKFGVYRGISWGGAGLGVLLVIIGWAVSPKPKPAVTAE